MAARNYLHDNPSRDFLTSPDRYGKMYRGIPEGKSIVDLLKTARSLSESKVELFRAREQARRNPVISPAQIEELAQVADEAWTRSRSEQYAMMELIQAAAVANCGLTSRSRLSIRLALASEFVNKLERARQAYADAVEGAEILRRFFTPYHLVLFDFDEDEVESIAESAGAGWNKVKSRCLKPLEILDLATVDPAKEWMDLVVWNCDSGTGQGLLSQVDATLRLALRFEHWIDKKRESIVPVVEKMRAHCETIAHEDSLLAARCLVTIVAINLVGDQLRDVLNPRLASHYGV